MQSIYIYSRFTLVNHKLKFLLTYLVNEILGENFDTLVRSNFILEYCRTKWNEKLVPRGRFSKLYYFEEK